MITDFIPKEARPAPASRTFQLISDVWSHIPTDIDMEQGTRVAARALEILSVPTDAEFDHRVGWMLYLSLAVGLVALIGYALVGDPLMAWGGAGAFTFAAVVYGWYLMVTEPNA